MFNNETCEIVLSYFLYSEMYIAQNMFSEIFSDLLNV
jgi:hypothetical protein